MTQVLMRLYANGDRQVTVPLPSEDIENYVKYSECFRPGCALFVVDLGVTVLNAKETRSLHPQHIRTITMRKHGYLQPHEAERVAVYARETGNLWSSVPRAVFRDDAAPEAQGGA